MSPQAGWLLVNEIIPRLKSSIPNAVGRVGAEDVDELVQDRTAIAARMRHNCELRGKQVTAGNIVYYTVQHLRSGRRSTGSSQIDVMQPGTRLHRNVQLVSLDEPVPFQEYDNEVFTLGDMLSHDREDPATKAARRIDWKVFCRDLSERDLVILKHAAADAPLTEVAQSYGVSRSSIQANKNLLAGEIKEFMGQEILQECVQLPTWKGDLIAGREKQACRWERAVA